ncbi:hypothetical protein SKAU_G00132360 [Synaphobranchus kaupii]|uniref:Uncharacterized protein n=1 Tax=Synaphobranchus kaupii TaxID=118154 RepID=A0A9Q1FQM6_SYNKA|nr:hypothetical protein SKAU_G00132360 [Synaphobranchus kaupii]
MSQLDVKHPEVYNKFEKGFHVIRRSNQFWVGLSPDLVIETTLMRSLKTTGGMTHGSGMSEKQRALWTMSRPITAEYNIAMQEFTNLSYTTSEQHKDLTEARMKRDAADLEKISSKLAIWSPFSPDSSLRNIVTATTIVFDGYEEGPSIKDNTHQRRANNIPYPIVSFTAETEFSGKKEEFLSRDINKQRLIQMLSEELTERDCTVINAPGDADVDIVKAAVDASRLHTTTLIGEDTNLLVLLLYYAQGDNKRLYFRSDKSKADGSFKVYDINLLKEILGHDMCSQLMFIHAVTGCDTTSRIFGIGKKTAFQKFVKGDPVLQSFANAFTVPNQTPEVIDDLGSQVMAVLFGGKCTDSLATMRYNIFSKRVVSASSPVTPERLPPTESATKLHCRRAYYQIMVWMGKEEGMDAMNWGWNLQDDRFIPLMTNMNAAPESLLKVIHCNCSTACKTLRCSCRRYGLPCTTVCGPCQ